MSQDDTFQQLIHRVRAGEPQAAAELVRAYEPEVRRALRVWLTAPGLRRVLDSVDICQSVLANFFVRAAAGQFELQEPAQLIRLLITMARNRLRDHVRKLHAERRDQRRLAGGEVLKTAVDAHGTPSQIVAAQDMLQCLLERLSARERYLAEQRVAGRNWVDIGREVGTSADAARMQLHRGIDRAARELHLDEVGHD